MRDGDFKASLETSHVILSSTSQVTPRRLDTQAYTVVSLPGNQQGQQVLNHGEINVTPESQFYDA